MIVIALKFKFNELIITAEMPNQRIAKITIGQYAFAACLTHVICFRKNINILANNKSRKRALHTSIAKIPVGISGSPL
jgi:hypothetical protein